MMKKFSAYIFTMVFLMSSATSFADSPIPNEAYAVQSANGQFLLKMTPDGGIGGYGRGEGIAYELTEQGEELELWRVNFFSDNAHLLSDGRHLVAFGPWATEPSNLAVAFYRDGVLVKDYMIYQVLPDHDKYEYSVSHFQWKKWNDNAIKISEDESKLTIELVDGSFVSFDIKTGQKKS